MVSFVVYLEMRNTCRAGFVVASLSRLDGHNKSYTTRVWYFAVTHTDPLCINSISPTYIGCLIN